MKKTTLILMAIMVIMATIASCSDSETYADQKKRERSAINRFIKENDIKVLSETEFKANGEKTDTAKHEYVYLDNSGCYMQIIRKGAGEKLRNGETATILCRFREYNLLTDSLQSTNMVGYYISVFDKMYVTNTSGTFTGAFKSGESLLCTLYGSGSTSVPSGWLVPLTYINIGRQDSEENEIARIRIIVPHTQGHAYATSGVYPCLYDITYQRGY